MIESGVTVGEILKLPAFNGAKLVAGEKGLDKIVKHVDVMEVPDAANWVREQEMLLTTAYAVKNDVRAQEDLIIKLAEVKASALCIKPGRFIDRIPAKIINLGEELDFPVIELPPEVPYIDIINQVLSRILSKKAFFLETINRIHGNLIDVVLEGGGLQAICSKLCEITGYPVAVLDNNGRIVASSGSQERICRFVSGLELAKALEGYGGAGIPSTGILDCERGKITVTPIAIERKLYGYLIMFGFCLSENELNTKALEQGAIVAALEFLKEKNTMETKKRLTKDVLNDLLEGSITSIDVLKEKTSYLGWHVKEGMQVFAVHIEQRCKIMTKVQEIKAPCELQDCIKDIIKLTVKRIDPEAKVIDKSGRIIILLNVPEDYKRVTDKLNSYTKRIAINIREEIAKNFDGINIKVGIGRYYNGLCDMHKSYREALEALNLFEEITGIEQVVHFNDIGVYRILLDIHDKSSLHRFSYSYLQPLIEYDQQCGCDLVNTLEVYLKNNKNIKRTADELHVHRNTVRYRIDKINDILRMNLEDGEVMFNIYFSLKALKVINSLGRG